MLSDSKNIKHEESKEKPDIQSKYRKGHMEDIKEQDSEQENKDV
jgi:hypothetical protein